MTQTGRSGLGLVSFLHPFKEANSLIIVIVASLCQKFQKAKDAIETMDSAVEELTNSIGHNSWISEWKKSEENAKIQRGEALMIYNVAQPPGMF